MGQDLFDLIVILLLVFFAGRGFLNGFVAEIAGIVSLIGGIWGANVCHPFLSPYLTFVQDPTWRTIVAYVIIFVAILLGVGLLARVLRKIISIGFATWADRFAGLVLGLIKGLVLCSLAVMILQFIFRDADFLQNSRTIPYLSSLIDYVRTQIPDDLVARLTGRS